MVSIYYDMNIIVHAASTIPGACSTSFYDNYYILNLARQWEAPICNVCARWELDLFMHKTLPLN